MWGKIIGAVAGFAMGGPFGAVVGAAFGHAAESGGFGQFSLPGFSLPGAPSAARLAAMLGRREQYYAIASVVLSAKLAKCDGPVNRAEIDAFKRSFRIPPEAVAQVGRLFDQARRSSDGYEAYARQLGESFGDRKTMLEDMLSALFMIARADKPLTVAEQAYLRRVHLAFGLDDAAWERSSGGRSRTAGGPAEEDPYGILGVTARATDEEACLAWRGLMRENHPDSLAGRGASAEMIARAGEKVARINAAWDTIKRDRKL